MNKNIYVVIGGGILMVFALYFFGNTKGNNAAQKSTPPSKMEAAMAMNPSANIEDIDFDAYINTAQNKLIADKKTLLTKLLEAAKAKSSAVTFKDLAEFWEREKELNISAYYYKKAAFLENTENSITFAGNLFLAVMQKTEQPSLKKWQALEAIECFTKILAIQPTNTDAKIALATCYTEGTRETMKGVGLLRDITQVDSNNIPANILLGKLAIESGQLDKAKKRLNRVLSIKPNNTEAMYFLAEAYKNSGDKQKAISLFEQCKTIVNNKDFSKEIDNYINSFK